MARRIRTFDRAIPFLAFAALVACDSIETASRPEIVVLPPTVTFSEIALGDEQTVELRIRNEGNGDLVVSGADIAVSTDFVTVLSDFPLRIEPQTDVGMLVRYAPTTPDPTQGNVVLISNDPEQREFAIPISAQRPTPRASVYTEPFGFDFGIVAEQTENTRRVFVQNAGTAPMIVCDLAFAGSPDYRNTLDTVMPAAGEPNLVIRPLGTDAAGIETLEFDVIYQPSSPGEDRTELSVAYDSIGDQSGACEEGRIRIETFEFTGEAGSPTLQVTPNPVNFGETPAGGGYIDRQVVTLTNVGEIALEIFGVELDSARPTSPDFGLEETPEATVTLGPDESTTFIVTYEPVEFAADAGAVLIEHSDGLGGVETTDVLLSGVGVEDDCPTAVGVGYIRQDAENRRGSEIDWAAPLQTLILDASGSFDPDGSTLSDYVWEIVQQEPGAVNGLDIDPSHPDDSAYASYFIPVAGQYRFRLRVFDESGFESCSPAEVSVLAIPQEAITIEITWTNRPADANEDDDDGSDADLHFVKMPAPWFDRTFDAYYGNVAPNWSPELPSLDRDDTDGAGPETAQLDNPANCQWYAVGVHYFREKYGAATATVRIYINGNLAQEFVGVLGETDDFWDVARIHWPSGTVYEVNDYISGFNGDVDQIVPGPTPAMESSGLCGAL
jgi:hypothetical protein